MDIEAIINNGNITIEKSRIYFNEPMKKHTTFKIGGPAECFIKIKSENELKEILNLAENNKIKITILGNGSNVLVSDKGIKGITLMINIDKVDIINKKDKVSVIVGAGEKNAKLARVLLDNEIAGMEELSGIPGTIGGLVTMNAGAHKKEIQDIVKIVKCLDYKGNEKIFTKEEMEFGYRDSILKKQEYIVTEVEFELSKGNKKDIKNKIEEYTKYRLENQPIEFPSAGSTFKRGDDFVTAKLIDEAGLKGYSIGGAEISTKHSGFIINKGDATAKDVLDLVKYIKDKIKKKFDKEIELEIELIGE